ALQFFDKALKIYEKNYGTKHPEIANTYNQMATVYLEQKNYEKATIFCQKALIANSLDFDDRCVRNNPNIANNYNPTIFLSSLLLKAKIFEELHFAKTLKLRDIKLALACLQRCDELIAHLRRVSSNKNDKLALGATAAEVYEDAIRLCLHLADVTLARQKYEQLAFDFAEKSKSAVLLNAISDANAKEFAGLPVEVLEKEKSLKVEIAFYEQKLGEKGQNEQAVRNKLFDLNQAYDNFIKELEKKYPAYYDLKFNVKTATVQDLQGLLDKNTEVVSYFIAERSKRLYIFRTSQQNLTVYNEPLAEDLQKWITILRNAMVYKATKEYLNVAYLLKKQLFPFSLKNKNYICIPDGRLGIIPFEALLAEKVSHTTAAVDFSQLPYLLNKSYFSYAYSHTLLF
ncbi:MAG: tetratricopeptide repeat protein, partial [Thermoflexibacteraceae bacterium]